MPGPSSSTGGSIVRASRRTGIDCEKASFCTNMPSGTSTTSRPAVRISHATASVVATPISVKQKFLMSGRNLEGNMGADAAGRGRVAITDSPAEQADGLAASFRSMRSPVWVGAGDMPACGRTGGLCSTDKAELAQWVRHCVDDLAPGGERRLPMSMSAAARQVARAVAGVRANLALKLARRRRSLGDRAVGHWSSMDYALPNCTLHVFTIKLAPR